MNYNIYEKKILEDHLNLPFLKVNLEDNENQNLNKKLDISLGEIHKETGNLIRRINNYSSQFRKIGTHKYKLFSPKDFKRCKKNSKINISKLYHQISHNSKQLYKIELTKTKEFHFNSMNDILKSRLNKYKYKNNRQQINFFKTSSLDSFPSYDKINNCNKINYNLYDSNNSFEITLSKGNDKKKNIEKLIIRKIPTINISRNTNIKTMNNIYKIHSIYNDMKKSFHNINYNLLHLYHDKNKKNKVINNLKKINIKRINLKDNYLKKISIENDRIKYPILFEPIKDLLNKPLKQIKIDNSKNNTNKYIWMKKSTANLLTFGQVSQSMNDDIFYKERKRIVNSYPIYEKDANINVEEKRKEYYSPRIKLNISMKKVGNLINMNQLLIKNIYNKKI